MWNPPLFTVIEAVFAAQFVKVLIQRWRENVWDLKVLFETGGMPSSHSALVTALAVKMGMTYGWGSSWFAVSATVAIVVMYDATGVRRQAGEMAVILDEWMQNLREDRSWVESSAASQLRHWRRKGHTPLEVLGGAILGSGIALLSGL